MVNDEVVDPVAEAAVDPVAGAAVQAAAVPHAELEEPLVEPTDGLVAPHDPGYDEDEYYRLGANTPPPPGRKQRRSRSTVFGKGAAMRLLDGHEARERGFTHKCTCPLPPAMLRPGYSICGTLMKLGRDTIHNSWLTWWRVPVTASNVGLGLTL